MAEIDGELRIGASETPGFPMEQLQVQEPEVGENEDRPLGIQFWTVFLSMMLTLFMIGLDSSILATAVPSITNRFHTINDVGWYFSAASLGNCAFQFMFGKLYTLYPTKVLFSAAVVLFTLSSVICATAQTSIALIIGRLLTGISGAGTISGIFIMIGESLPLHKRALFGALTGATEVFAMGLGPVVGGTITDRIGWRVCFWINIPIGAVVLVVFLSMYRSPARETSTHQLTWKQKLLKVDPISTAFFVPSIICLLIAVQWGSSNYGWSNVRVIAMFCVFAALLIPFIYRQYRRGDEAAIPFRIVKQRSILCGMLFSACANAAMSIVQVYMPIYNQTILGLSAQESGILSLGLVGGLFSSALLAGSLTGVIGFYTPFMLMGSILGPIAAGLLTTLSIDKNIVKVILYQFLLGFGCGIGFQAPQVAAQTVLAPKDVPLGIAAVLFAQMLGPTILVAVAQALFQSRIRADMHEYAPGVNITLIENLGLSDLKGRVGTEFLTGALRGYDKSVDQVFYLPLALMCLSLVGSLAMEWRSVKKKTQ